MSRAHHICLFNGRDEYVLFHPSCADVVRAAARFPVHAVGRVRAGRSFAYAVENASLLWDFLRREGHTMCRECAKASCDSNGYTVDGKPFEARNAPVATCSQVDWEESWIQTTGMSRYETIPEWERLWEDVVRGFHARQRVASAPPIDKGVHEQVLGLSPPYDRDGVLRAFKQAAMVAHPDRGGSNDAMRRVIEARDALL